MIRLVEAVEELVPSPSEHKKLVGHLKQLERPDGVCKLLQSDATTMSELLKLDLSRFAMKRNFRPLKPLR